ncbi:MAG: imidazole glycerol phosphate synthase subunit HisH [Planctomycetota bacterium]|nr:imidazole glycerol phosphate synthase subunit HisH [Planctomycetota bacterium]
MQAHRLPSDVVIVRTGTANLASVFACLRRCGATHRMAENAEDVRSATRVLMPGVGTFGAAMESLHQQGLIESLRERITSEKATMAICLGLQLLFEASEESPGVRGLGVAPGVIERFSRATGVRVPQLGWNDVEPVPGFAAFARGEAYFANSYRAAGVPAGWTPAWTNYPGPFVAAMERAKGRVLACQFHPELSGPWGQSLVAGWLARASA